MRACTASWWTETERPGGRRVAASAAWLIALTAAASWAAGCSSGSGSASADVATDTGAAGDVEGDAGDDATTGGPGADASPDATTAADTMAGPDGAGGDDDPSLHAAQFGDCEAVGWLEVTLGDAALRVHYGSGAWQLEAAGRTLAGPGGCGDVSPVRVAGQEPPMVDYLFGAFRFDMDVVGWHGTDGTGTAAVTRDGSAYEVRWTLVGDRGTAGVRFDTDASGRARISMVADAAPPGGVLTWREDGPDTGYFGLGAQVTGLNLRGRAYPLWTQEQGIGKWSWT